MYPNLLEIPKSWNCETCRLSNLDSREACCSDSNQEKTQDPFKMNKAKNMINVSGKPVSSKTIGSSSGTSQFLLSNDFLLEEMETEKVKILSLEEIYAKTNPCSPHSSPCPQIGSLCAANTSVGGSGSSISSSKKAQPRKIHEETCLKSPSQFPSRSQTSEISKSVENTTTNEKSTSVGEHSSLLNTRTMVCGIQGKHSLENAFSDLEKHAGKVNSSHTKTYMCNKKAVVVTVNCKEDRTLNPTTMFKFGEEELPNPPAAKASWKGNFAIHNFPGQLCDGFQAYPPGKVSRKAFLVSKQMPSVLQFTLQRRSNVWPETFKVDPPCGSDIALYFLANDINGSREYISLLKLLEENDLSMQSYLDGVELLVFTSKQLPPESQRINKKVYLWGVFVSPKERQFTDTKGKQLTFKTPLLDHKSSEDPVVVTDEVNANEIDMEIDMVGGKQVNTNEVDMEIDMVGGKEVGNVDKFLRRNSISACLENSNSPSQDVPASINSDSVGPPGFCTFSLQMKVSPGAFKVDTHSFSERIIKAELDSPPKVAHMEGDREVGIVDKCCRNSLSICHDNLDTSSNNVTGLVTSSHKDTAGFSKSSALVNVSPDANLLDTHCLSKPIKIEERDSSPKCASESAKSTVAAQEDPEDVVCVVCREGYSLRPNDIMGIYSYTKRVDLDIGTAASSRIVGVYSTVSNFSIIHFRCHQEAGLKNPKKEFEAGLKNPKKEFEGCTLSNSEVIHTCLFPLRGPLVQLQQYRSQVSKYWDSLIVLHGQADGNRIRLLTYDIVLMLSRFATEASFNTDTKCGGRESNARFLPFMIQMAQCLVEQGRTLMQREAMADGISSYLSSTSSNAKSSAPPGFHRPCGSEDTVQYVMLNSLFFESYNSWLTHRRAFLQRAIHHAYLQNKHGRAVLLISGEPCLKSEPVDTSEIFEQGNYLFTVIRPMLVFIGLIELLQRFLKLNNTGNAADVKINGNNKTSLESWEVTMKAKLVNVKEMLYLSEKLLSWLDDMKSTDTLEEAFSVMGVVTDVLADEFSSCEGFVQAAIQSGKEMVTSTLQGNQL